MRSRKKNLEVRVEVRLLGEDGVEWNQVEGFESETLNFIDLFQILGIFGQSIKKMFD